LTAPTLVFGWGNPSRGDDALGPLFLEHFASLAGLHPEWGAVDTLTDFQLQVEHALDLQGRRRVLFVDASLDASAPCSIERIGPAANVGFTTHAMSPQAVLSVFAEIEDAAPPPTWLLAIRGERFELGEDITPAAMKNLAAALEEAARWIATESS
jgi:hydrogenase maturation protease